MKLDERSEVVNKVNFWEAYNNISLKNKRLILIACIILLLIYAIFGVQTLLILLIIIIGFQPFTYMLFSRNSNAFHPSYIIPFTYSFYALGPMFNVDKFSQGVISSYLFIQLIGLIGLRVGLKQQTKYRSQDFHLPRNSDVENNILYAGICMVLISIPSIILEINAFGGVEEFFNVGYGTERYLIMQNSTTFGASFQWLILSGVIIGFYGMKTRSLIYSFIGASIFSATTYYFFMIGGRSTLIYIIIYCAILLFYSIKKNMSRFIGSFVIIGMIFAQAISYARFYLSQGFIGAMHQTWLLFLKKPLIFLPIYSNEFRMPSRSLMEVLQFGGPGLQFGRTYLSSITAIVPFLTRLIPDVGFDPVKWYLTEYHNDLLLAGGGLGFSPVTEGYINFGIVGVFFHMFIYGYIIVSLYNYYHKTKNVASLILYAGAFPMFMLEGLRIHSTSFLYKLFRIYLVPFIVVTIIRFVQSKMKVRE
ncbi:O-antigen polymerase [Youngiibacter multivorans]|uniref:Oligosaccharide repeat unit polymerase n=1 Tax=Youngiibacter multivorans TaxID=937251 RepID=A0ABS4G393_9CLOT|nr:O-antigen polymerase [Youngiibacter multivorans]MBP1919012.1 oligosaccharide repeat unit polymerase [Youngiibacter multivorans]